MNLGDASNSDDFGASRYFQANDTERTKACLRIIMEAVAKDGTTTHALIHIRDGVAVVYSNEEEYREAKEQLNLRVMNDFVLWFCHNKGRYMAQVREKNSIRAWLRERANQESAS